VTDEPKLNAGLTDQTRQESGEDVPFREPTPARARGARKPRKKLNEVPTESGPLGDTGITVVSAQDQRDGTVEVPDTPAVRAAQDLSRALHPRTCWNGHEVSESMNFCPECGGQIPDESALSQCPNGHEVSPEHKFCATCGAALRQEAGFSAVAVRPKPESELSAEELAERQRAHEAAIRLGSNTPTDVQYYPGSAPSGVQSTVIHFLVDGLDALGTVWYRGQEAEVWPGHPRWPEMQSLLAQDTAEQFRRYGRQMFAVGPWPGERSYTAGAGKFQQLKTVSGDGSVAQPSEDELARADEMERRRNRRVPMPLGF
jgi:hypothetical protein